MVSSTSQMTPDDLRRYPPRSLQTGTYFSQALQKEQSFAYYTPESWNGDLSETTSRYPLLIMLHGLNSDYLGWHTCTRIARYASAYGMVVAFPDGGNGWYTNATDGTADYEDDLINDFLPHLQKTLPLLQEKKNRAIGGMSMGGYGAVKIAMKHWSLFGTAVSHSGAFEKPQIKDAHPVFGHPTENAQCRRKENPFALAELGMCRWPTERPYLYLDCGEEDFLLDTNRRLRDHLHFIAYPHTYTETQGQHTYPYWDRAFRTILPRIANRIGAERLPLPQLVKP